MREKKSDQGEETDTFGSKKVAGDLFHKQGFGQPARMRLLKLPARAGAVLPLFQEPRRAWCTKVLQSYLEAIQDGSASRL